MNSWNDFEVLICKDTRLLMLSYTFFWGMCDRFLENKKIFCYFVFATSAKFTIDKYSLYHIFYSKQYCSFTWYAWVWFYLSLLPEELKLIVFWKVTEKMFCFTPINIALSFDICVFGFIRPYRYYCPKNWTIFLIILKTKKQRRYAVSSSPQLFQNSL